LSAEIGLLDPPIEEGFALQSYTLLALITIGARRGHRSTIADKWRRISRIHCSEFYPDATWQFFLWRAENGDLKSMFPAKTQSWTALQAEATERSSASTIPGQLRANPELLPLFLMVYPHRLRSDVAGFLDGTVG